MWVYLSEYMTVCVTVTEDLEMESIREFTQSVVSVWLFSVISFLLLKMQWNLCCSAFNSVDFTGLRSLRCLS